MNSENNLLEGADTDRSISLPDCGANANTSHWRGLVRGIWPYLVGQCTALLEVPNRL
jgi:hypothetical protein